MSCSQCHSTNTHREVMLGQRTGDVVCNDCGHIGPPEYPQPAVPVKSIPPPPDITEHLLNKIIKDADPWIVIKSVSVTRFVINARSGQIGKLSMQGAFTPFFQLNESEKHIILVRMAMLAKVDQEEIDDEKMRLTKVSTTTTP